MYCFCFFTVKEKEEITFYAIWYSHIKYDAEALLQILNPFRKYVTLQKNRPAMFWLYNLLLTIEITLLLGFIIRQYRTFILHH